jgi:hypothetical protein
MNLLSFRFHSAAHRRRSPRMASLNPCGRLAVTSAVGKPIHRVSGAQKYSHAQFPLFKLFPAQRKHCAKQSSQNQNNSGNSQHHPGESRRQQGDREYRESNQSERRCPGSRFIRSHSRLRFDSRSNAPIDKKRAQRNQRRGPGGQSDSPRYRKQNEQSSQQKNDQLAQQSKRID